MHWNERLDRQQTQFSLPYTMQFMSIFFKQYNKTNGKNPTNGQQCFQSTNINKYNMSTYVTDA